MNNLILSLIIGNLIIGTLLTALVMHRSGGINKVLEVVETNYTVEDRAIAVRLRPIIANVGLLILAIILPTVAIVTEIIKIKNRIKYQG